MEREMQFKKSSNLDHGAFFDVEMKMVDEEGQFEGYASIFNQRDKGRDIVVPGAFAKSLQAIPAARVRMLYQHDPSQVIGKWTEVREDGKGLYVKGQLILDVPKAKEVHALLKGGAIDGLSIGYRTIDDDRSRDTGERKLKEVELWEVSVVTFPMLPTATVDTVKNGSQQDNGMLFTPREVEALVRDVKECSQSEAKRIVAAFKKNPDAIRDVGRDQALIQSLHRASQRMTQTT